MHLVDDRHGLLGMGGARHPCTMFVQPTSMYKNDQPHFGKGVHYASLAIEFCRCLLLIHRGNIVRIIIPPHMGMAVLFQSGCSRQLSGGVSVMAGVMARVAFIAALQSL